MCIFQSPSATSHFQATRARVACTPENHSLACGAETHTLQTSMGMDTLPAVPSEGYLLFMGPVTLNGQEKEMKPRHKGIKIRAGS